MFRGLVIPALFVAYGLYFLVTGEGFIFSRLRGLEHSNSMRSAFGAC